MRGPGPGDASWAQRRPHPRPGSRTPGARDGGGARASPVGWREGRGAPPRVCGGAGGVAELARARGAPPLDSAENPALFSGPPSLFSVVLDHSRH
jgi:hypothetical protein